MILTYEAVAGRIDHALLAPAMTTAEMIAGCEVAALYEVASVCIKPYAVPLAVAALRDSAVRVGTVVGFPHGSVSARVKEQETIEAIKAGAVEIDMVVNIGAVLAGEWLRVAEEIGQINSVTHQYGAILKVIFETCYLEENAKIELCRIASEIGVDYVKTSTGFGTNGATFEDIRLMRRECPTRVKVKASGNIKNLATAIEFCELGAERLGLSRTAAILDELCHQLNQPLRIVPRETNKPGSTPDY